MAGGKDKDKKEDNNQEPKSSSARIRQGLGRPSQASANANASALSDSSALSSSEAFNTSGPTPQYKGLWHYNTIMVEDKKNQTVTWKFDMNGQIIPLTKDIVKQWHDATKDQLSSDQSRSNSSMDSVSNASMESPSGTSIKSPSDASMGSPNGSLMSTRNESSIRAMELHFLYLKNLYDSNAGVNAYHSKEYSAILDALEQIEKMKIQTEDRAKNDNVMGLYHPQNMKEISLDPNEKHDELAENERDALDENVLEISNVQIKNQLAPSSERELKGLFTYRSGILGREKTAEVIVHQSVQGDRSCFQVKYPQELLNGNFERNREWLVNHAMEMLLACRAGWKSDATAGSSVIKVNSECMQKAYKVALFALEAQGLKLDIKFKPDQTVNFDARSVAKDMLDDHQIHVKIPCMSGNLELNGGHGGVMPSVSELESGMKKSATFTQEKNANEINEENESDEAGLSAISSNTLKAKPIPIPIEEQPIDEIKIPKPPEDQFNPFEGIKLPVDENKASPIVPPSPFPIAELIAAPIQQPVAPPIQQPVAPPIQQPTAPLIQQPVAPPKADPIVTSNQSPTAQSIPVSPEKPNVNLSSSLPVTDSISFNFDPLPPPPPSSIVLKDEFMSEMTFSPSSSSSIFVKGDVETTFSLPTSSMNIDIPKKEETKANQTKTDQITVNPTKAVDVNESGSNTKQDEQEKRQGTKRKLSVANLQDPKRPVANEEVDEFIKKLKELHHVEPAQLQRDKSDLGSNGPGEKAPFDEKINFFNRPGPGK